MRASLKKLPALEPLSPGRYRLQLTLSVEQKDKLELARDLLSHANTSGDLTIVIERALDELISRLEKRRFGRTQSPPARDCADARTVADARPRMPGESTAASAVDQQGERRRKHIAHQTRRDLLTRDGARCAFVGNDGKRCDARAFLQFHHRQAWARGGGDTANNLELLCSGHNRLLAEQDFGRARIDAAITTSKARRTGMNGTWPGRPPK